VGHNLTLKDTYFFKRTRFSGTTACRKLPWVFTDAGRRTVNNWAIDITVRLHRVPDHPHRRKGAGRGLRHVGVLDESDGDPVDARAGEDAFGTPCRNGRAT
jgi:hypothetical protein